MIDKIVPDFEIPATGNAAFRLTEYRGKIVILYFYPKDSTPGCTTEAQQFRDLHGSFSEANCVIAGVSRDSLRSHENFKTKQDLPFDLLSDSSEALCTQFGVIKNKKLYGKPVRGIERSTFVIDREGALRREWRGVKAEGHAQDVLDFVRTL
jgi:peroxiredoxin Q/BCP